MSFRVHPPEEEQRKRVMEGCVSYSLFYSTPTSRRKLCEVCPNLYEMFSLSEVEQSVAGERLLVHVFIVHSAVSTSARVVNPPACQETWMRQMEDTIQHISC